MTKIKSKFQLVFAIFFAFLETTSAQASRPCSLSPDQGECVKYNDCRYALVYGGFYVTEIKTRRSKCSQYGREFICCEVKTIGKKPAPVRAPTTTRRQTAFSFISRQPTKTFTTRTTSRTSQTTHPTTRFTTLRTLAPQVLAVTNPEVFQSLQVDPLHHQNYQLFKYPKCGIIRSSDRVAYGNDSELFEFPWAAQLGYEKNGKLEFDCGGSLISERYVLTAAHCLVFLKSTLKLVLVRLGEYDSSRALDCTESDDYNEAECADPVQDINIRSFIAHPGFGHNRLEMIHDIGLVQLDEAANFKQKNIKPICLPFTQTLQTLPSKFLAIGWGLNEKRQKPSILQKASLPLYDSFACQRELSRIKKKASTVVEGQFCAGGEGKVDTCSGDSGSSIQSPGIVNGKKRMVQYGIVSYGVRSCGVETGLPGIYTKVGYYIDWILNNVQ